MNTIDAFIANIDNTLLGYVQGVFGDMFPIVSQLWTLMFAVFIAFYGYKVIISGRLEIKDIMVHSFKFVLIFALATKWDTFSAFIYDIITNAPSDIAGILLSASNGSPDVISANTALGLFYERSHTVSSKIIAGAGWNMVLASYGWAVWLAGLAVGAYATFLIVLGKIATALMLSIAPIFILLIIFKQSVSIFEGWLRALLNYALIPIFVYGILAIMLTFINLPLEALDINSSATSKLMTYIAPFLLSCVVSTALLMQITNITSGIAGGLSLSTMGLAGKFTSRPAQRAMRSASVKAQRAVGRRSMKIINKGLRRGAYSQEAKIKSFPKG